MLPLKKHWLRVGGFFEDSGAACGGHSQVVGDCPALARLRSPMRVSRQVTSQTISWWSSRHGLVGCCSHPLSQHLGPLQRWASPARFIGAQPVTCRRASSPGRYLYSRPYPRRNYKWLQRYWMRRPMIACGSFGRSHVATRNGGDMRRERYGDGSRTRTRPCAVRMTQTLRTDMAQDTPHRRTCA